MTCLWVKVIDAVPSGRWSVQEEWSVGCFVMVHSPVATISRSGFMAYVDDVKSFGIQP